MSDDVRSPTDDAAPIVPPAVLESVARFEEQRTAFRASAYNEQQLRIDFLNPVLAALGWDVQNAARQVESLRDVVYEDKVKIGGSTKAPDYGMRLGGVRKFFVEAKKPAVDLRVDSKPAFQLRRYAWSAKLPLSILTDFEEWSIYDCRLKPSAADGPAVGRLFYIRYDELAARWSELADLFSRDAVQSGSLDRFAAESRRKRGTEAVDDAFLADLEGWRELLARNIALRNTGLSVRALNEAVQQTLDRIIFLRICEDRGIEAEGQLQGYLNGANVYARLGELFRRADAKYNAGLFHFRDEKGRSGTVDDWTLQLVIDDKVLRDIIRRLYVPECPYAFEVIPADILGQVYERFLGKVIRLTPAGRAVVEEKPEVRKAGGVYYTPTFVVDYIVQHTVGPLLEGKNPAAAADLRIVDPACGSGSFLLGAYQHLLDWHLNWYTAHDPKKHKDAVRETDDGGWRLTTAERKRILRANIYGVDIDPQAVEVTKLSLLLKVLEGETDETLTGQMRLVQDRALPDLGHNVQCGNSLIGSDELSGVQLALPADANERQQAMDRINAFNWRDALPEVFGRGGFDAVIGNPPYVRIQAMKEWAPFEVELYKQRYRSASKGNYDLYVVFVERGLQLLNARGRLGYILPHKFFNAQYGAPLRGLIAEGRHLAEVVHFGDQQIFGGATTYTCLMFLQGAGEEVVHFTQVDDVFLWRLGGIGSTVDIQVGRIGNTEWTFMVANGARLLDKVRERPLRLGDVTDRIFQGLITGADSVYILERQREDGMFFSRALDTRVRLEEGILRPLLKGAEIRRYVLQESANVLIYPYKTNEGRYELINENGLREEYPLVWQYLSQCRPILAMRESGKHRGDGWWRFGRSQNIAEMALPKVLTQVLASRGAFTDDAAGTFCFVGGGNAGGYGVIAGRRSHYSRLALLGLLNSQLADWYVKATSTRFRGGYYSYARRFLEPIPVPDIGPVQHDHLVTLVQRMLDLHKRLPELKSAHDRTLTQRQIEATDREIDRLVYELYELTDEEIGIVEGRGG